MTDAISPILLTAIAAVIVVVDLRHQLIPNVTVVALCILGLVRGFMSAEWPASTWRMLLTSGLGAAAVLYLLRSLLQRTVGFYAKAVFANNPKPDIKLVNYTNYLTGKNDPDADLLTTRRPARVNFVHKASAKKVALFTWHAPLSGAGGGVFNQAAHSFFAGIIDKKAANSVVIVAGDMNASSKQVANSYSNKFEASGNHLDHFLTNATIKSSEWYDDAKSDVHYLSGAVIEF